MISDVLFEATDDIRSYLSDAVYDDVYSGDIRDEIKAVLKQMEALRIKLDTPPSGVESLEKRGLPHD